MKDTFPCLFVFNALETESKTIPKSVEAKTRPSTVCILVYLWTPQVLQLYDFSHSPGRARPVSTMKSPASAGLVCCWWEVTGQAYWSLTASHCLGIIDSDVWWRFSTLKSFVEINIHTVLDPEWSVSLSDTLNQTLTTSSVPAARRSSTAAQRSRSAREKENKTSLWALESNRSCQVGFSL